MEASWPGELEARRRGRSTVVPEERSPRLSPWSWGPVRRWRRRPVPGGLPCVSARAGGWWGRWRRSGLASRSARGWTGWRRGTGAGTGDPAGPVSGAAISGPPGEEPAWAQAHPQDHPARESHRIRRRTWHSPHHPWPARRPAPHSKPCHDQILSLPCMSREHVPREPIRARYPPWFMERSRSGKTGRFSPPAQESRPIVCYVHRPASPRTMSRTRIRMQVHPTGSVIDHRGIRSLDRGFPDGFQTALCRFDQAGLTTRDRVLGYSRQTPSIIGAYSSNCQKRPAMISHRADRPR